MLGEPHRTLFCTEECRGFKCEYGGDLFCLYSQSIGIIAGMRSAIRAALSVSSGDADQVFQRGVQLPRLQSSLC